MSLTISPAQIVEESVSPLVAARDVWTRRPLGGVATILNGFAFKSKQFVAEGGKPLIRIRDLFDDTTAVGYAGEYDPRYLVHAGDLLIGMDGDFKCARWRGSEALLNQRVCKITPDADQLDLDFLTHLLPGYLKAIHELTSSTTVTHLSSRDIAQIPIPVPPIEEQRALARVFGTTTSKQQSSNRHLVNARRAIERFRRSVLAAACSGQLTADWRESRDESSGQLVEELRTHKANRPKPLAEPDLGLRSDLPASWELASLDLLIERIEAGKSFTAHGRHATEDEWGVIKVSAMTWGRFLETENKAVPETRAINPDHEIRPGDLLISRANTVDLVGATVLVDKTRPRLLLSDKSLRLCPYPAIDKAWLNYTLRSSLVRSQFSEHATGTSDSMRNLSQEKMLATTLPLPPEEEQTEIARRVDELLVLAEALTHRIDAASRSVERSSQAILAKAFRGDLISDRSD